MSRDKINNIMGVTAFSVVFGGVLAVIFWCLDENMTWLEAPVIPGWMFLSGILAALICNEDEDIVKCWAAISICAPLLFAVFCLVVAMGLKKAGVL